MSTARLLTVFATAAVLSSPAHAQEKPTIAWASDLAAARLQARQGKKAVIAYFTYDT